MTTLKSEFVDLAACLIGDEFADFAVSTTINQYGTFDYSTQTTPILNTAIIQTIKVDFKATQVNGQLIQAGDYMLIGEYQEVGFIPSVSNCKTVRAGVTAELKDFTIDPADATITMHVRPL